MDDYQDLLRIAVASAGNDHRLGANEAPPAIVSMFLGDELTEILEAIENGKPYVGTRKRRCWKSACIPCRSSRKDTTDRNRTSPFAFTGNKFEFRIAGLLHRPFPGTNMVLNTAVAEYLRQFADELESAQDFKATLHDLIVREIKAHKRIIFNGNGYSDAWVAEAEKRGLLNLHSTVDALPYMISDKNIKLFTSHKVFCGDGDSFPLRDQAGRVCEGAEH